MANTALTITNSPSSSGSAIQCFGSSLPKRIAAALTSSDGIFDLDLPTPDERKQIAPLVRQLQAAQVGATPREVDMAVAKLSVAFPTAKQSEDEAAARLDVYREALADVPPDILAEAVMACVRSCRFFPSVAEIREKARRGMAIRERQVGRLIMLARRFDKEYAPPGEPMTPEQVVELRQLSQRLGVANAEG